MLIDELCTVTVSSYFLFSAVIFVCNKWPNVDMMAQLTIALLLKESQIDILIVPWCRPLHAHSILADLPLEHFYCRLLIQSCAQISCLTMTGSFLAASSYTNNYAMVRWLTTEFDYRSHWWLCGMVVSSRPAQYRFDTARCDSYCNFSMPCRTVLCQIRARLPVWT